MKTIRIPQRETDIIVNRFISRQLWDEIDFAINQFDRNTIGKKERDDYITTIWHRHVAAIARLRELGA